ncbi:MAG: hypothetical protein H6755_06275 [Candidatus Omnitrophica bacterium]|nr:hypothetical protein [Candidatus Omnitrophota bacterium]
MLSILILFILLILGLVFIKYTTKKKTLAKFMTLGVFNLFIIECVVYILFLLQIIQANCFFLIGHQKFLDILIRARLTYATYFAQGRESFIYRLDNTLGYSIGASKDTGMYQSNSQGGCAPIEIIL